MSVSELVPGQTGRSEFERTPPQDLGAEQSVLGGMLLSKDAIADVVEVLKSADFYRPAHQIVFDTVLDLYGKGEPADPVTVSAELARSGQLARVGGAPYLHTLISSVPTAANAGYYAKIVADRAVMRRLVEAGTRIVQLGYGADAMDAEAAVDLAEAQVYDVAERRTGEDYVLLEQCLQGTLDEIESIGNRGGVMTGVPTGFADLDALMHGLHPGQLIVVAARPAIGKALALDTPLPTPTGWTTMGQVQVGDEVLGADGRPTRVVAATEVMTGRPCYEVSFSDGTTVVCDADHQWLTETRASRRSAQVAAVGDNGHRNQRTLAEVRTTAEIAATLRCPTADQRLNHSVTNAAPLQLPEREDLLVAPYTLGAWLGDGHRASARITSADPEIPHRIQADGYRVVAQGGLLFGVQLPPPPPVEKRECVVCGAAFLPRTTQVRTCGKVCGCRSRDLPGALPDPTCPDCGGPSSSGFGLCQACRDRHGTLQARLRTLGVLGDKHIPQAYLRASERQRRDLLAGLMDTDGTVVDTGAVQFTTTNRRLAEGVAELVASLGYRCSTSTRAVRGRTAESSTCFLLTFTTTDRVFHLPRKHENHTARHPRDRAGVRSRYITSARPVPSVPVRCIQVENDDHLYLAGRSMVPTHNSTLGLDFARAAAIKHQLPSVIFSLEMSRSEITMRLLSAEARVPLHHMRGGTMTDDDWSKLARRMGEVAEAPLYIDDSPNLTMMEIRSKARRLKQRHDLRLVIVDYMQLMSTNRRVESRQQEVSEMSRAMKLLAKELEVPVVAISQLNRGPEQRTDKRPQLSDLRESGCLTADTRVLRADTGAETTMAELFASDARDVPVWALDERMRYVRRHLTHVFSTGTKPVHKLRLASGREVRATDNHPFLTYEGWVRLGNLRIGDRVAAPRHVPAPERTTVWTDDEVLLLAHLIGDGSFVHRQPIRYASQDEANLHVVAQAAAAAFGITAIRDCYEQARVTTLRLPAPYRLARGRRNPVAAWLDGLGLFGARSHEKFVPEPVFALPKRQISLFLRHLWATDGCIFVRAEEESGPRGVVYYATTSRRLADDVARLLWRYGIQARIKTTSKSGYRPGYQVHLYGVADQRAFLRVIGTHGARGEIGERLLRQFDGIRSNTNVDTIPRQVWDKVRDVLQEQGMSHREFSAAIGTQFCGSTLWQRAPTRARMQRVAGVLGDADLEMLATNDVAWDAVVSIEPDGEEEVFDATVLGAHNFVANGIAVHNSIEQDADVVILLSREDAYEKESPRAGEADFIVAKHRNGPTATVTVAFQGHYSRFVDMSPA